MKIYLISQNPTGGYAVVDTEEAAQALEAIGWNRCTSEEYKVQVRVVRLCDASAADQAEASG